MHGVTGDFARIATHEIGKESDTDLGPFPPIRTRLQQMCSYFDLGSVQGQGGPMLHEVPGELDGCHGIVLAVMGRALLPQHPLQ